MKNAIKALNGTRESQQEERRCILRDLFGAGGDTVSMQPPFYCDYGSNIYLGTRVFFNFNCVVLDVCEVRIGDYSLFGPGAQILTPLHPLTPGYAESGNLAGQSRSAPTSGLVAAH